MQKALIRGEQQLLDVASLRASAARHAADAAAFVATWREKQLGYAFAATIMNAYEDFDALTLRYAVARHGVNIAAPELELLAAQSRSAQPFPDAKPALAQLRRRGLRCAVLTNGFRYSALDNVERSATAGRGEVAGLRNGAAAARLRYGERLGRNGSRRLRHARHLAQPHRRAGGNVRHTARANDRKAARAAARDRRPRLTAARGQRFGRGLRSRERQLDFHPVGIAQKDLHVAVTGHNGFLRPNTRARYSFAHRAQALDPKGNVIDRSAVGGTRVRRLESRRVDDRDAIVVQP